MRVSGAQYVFEQLALEITVHCGTANAATGFGGATVAVGKVVGTFVVDTMVVGTVVVGTVVVDGDDDVGVAIVEVGAADVDVTATVVVGPTMTMGEALGETTKLALEIIGP